MTYQGPDDQHPPQYQQPYQQPYPQQPYPQYPPPPPGYGGYPPPSRGNGLAIAALVCGLIGLLIFNILLGPLALIFGGIGLKRANRGASGRGMAIAGIVLGAIDLIFGVVAIAYLSSHGFVV